MTARTVTADRLRERARRWLDDELNRARLAHRARWAEHEAWVREYLAHELRERIANFGKVSRGSR